MGCERGRDHTRTSGDIWDVKEVGTILMLQVTYVCERGRDHTRTSGDTWDVRGVGTMLPLQVTHEM